MGCGRGFGRICLWGMSPNLMCHGVLIKYELYQIGYPLQRNTLNTVTCDHLLLACDLFVTTCTCEKLFQVRHTVAKPNSNKFSFSMPKCTWILSLIYFGLVFLFQVLSTPSRQTSVPFKTSPWATLSLAFSKSFQFLSVLLHFSLLLTACSLALLAKKKKSLIFISECHALAHSWLLHFMLA